ncbi:hypothetical protein AusDCA_2600 [Desulfitobacterium sp. AusDCA]
MVFDSKMGGNRGKKMQILARFLGVFIDDKGPSEG